MIVGKVKVDMMPVNAIIQRHGLGPGGDVQCFHTQNVLRRIQKYMPYRTGLTIKTMIAASPTSEPFITVPGPYARYLYEGKVMVNAATGKGPPVIPHVGPRWRRGTQLKATDRPLEYTKTKNPLAGPHWDRRLVAAEMDAMQADLQRYVKLRGVK